MDIKQTIELKRSIEKDIAEYMHRRIWDFEEQTGTRMADLSVDICEVTKLGDENRRFCIANVKIKVEL